MASIVPNIHIDSLLHGRLCAELGVAPCEILFAPDPSANSVFVRGTYNRIGAKKGLITIHLHRSLVGKRLNPNKRKRIEKSILTTLLHEYRHHWQYDHQISMVMASRNMEYSVRPIEIDARQFARGAVNRYAKLVSISRPSHSAE